MWRDISVEPNNICLYAECLDLDLQCNEGLGKMRDVTGDDIVRLTDELKRLVKAIDRNAEAINRRTNFS